MIYIISQDLIPEPNGIGIFVKINNKIVELTKEDL